MGKKHAVKCFLLMLLVGIIILAGRKEADAASYPARYSPEEIGLSTSDTSIVGVNFYLEDQLKFYVHDVWHNNGTGWYYDHTNLDGKVEPITKTKYNSDLVWLLDPSENKERFGIIMSNIKSRFGSYENFSVIIEHYYNNIFVNSVLETPFQDMDSYDQRYSLMYRFRNGTSTYPVGGYAYNNASFRYKLYKILDIGTEGDIVTVPGTGSVTGNGQAYYDGKQYIIASLPAISLEREGYHCEFAGWYSDLEGGKRYEVGDAIEKGTKIYPHWKKTPIKYPVKCIDILGEDASGLKIGESAWMQEYDSVIAGSQAGCLPLESIYYDGMVYHGCSQKVVGLTDNVIYRYFDYAKYPVQIVDRIVEGPNAGKELLTVSRQECYKASVSGEIMGTDKTVGAYYQGYSYQQSTSAIVGVNGATVYRYFVPVQYNISFDGNGATSGKMESVYDCWYDQEYKLISNNYKKEIDIQFDLQAEDAVCDSQGKKAFLQWSGWSESRNGGVRFSDQEYVKNLQSANGESILYAVWGSAEVAITTVPRRMGYIFAGWSENPEATAGNTEFILEEDTTLYAVWKPDVAEYHVEYYKENSDGNFQMTTQYAFSNYIGSMISIENTIPNYQGFYLDQGSSTLQGMVNGDGSLVLMAYYRRNTYRVIFDELPEEGEEEGKHTLQGVFEQEIKIPDKIPQREGYQFMGWTADPDSTQIYVKPGDTYRIPNHDQILYAVWQPKPYTVKFQHNIPDAEQDTAEGNMADYTGYYEKDFVLPECGWTRRGYQFMGWNTSANGTGTSYQEKQQVHSLYQEQNRSITLYATWKPLEGEIQYQINVPAHTSSVGKGKMNNTKYQFGTQWSLEPCHFELPGYQFCGWNTRVDGKGDFYGDRAEMEHKMPVSGVQNLYAVWKPRTDTKFYLQVEKKSLDTQEPDQEIIVMEGETDSKVSDAILAYYRNLGVNTSIRDFITGFTVMNPAALEQSTVKTDEQTIVPIQLERKRYQVQILRDASDPESDCYRSEGILYEDVFQFPESVDGIGKVTFYLDQEGNRFLPGETIKIDHDYFFMAQHSVRFHIGKEIQERSVSHNMPVTLEKPEEKEFYFDGWYWDETCRDFAGNAGDILYFTENRELYAKWSAKKIVYHIQYHLGNSQEIAFLEEPIEQYCCGDNIVLPVAAQLLIPSEYEFVGWYDQQDIHKSIVTMISQEAYGDQTFCLQLRKRSSGEESGNLGKDPEKDPGNPEKDPGNPGKDPGSPEKNPESPEKDPGNLEKDPGSPEKNPETPGKNPDDTISQSSADSNSQDSLGTVSGQGSDSISIVLQPVSSIHSSKKKAAKATFQSFTKGKITYCRDHSGKKNVTVVSADKKAINIKIPSYVIWKGVRYSVTAIDSRAFYGHKKLKKVTIGKKVTRIGREAFYGCKKLKTVVMKGKTVGKIQRNAFKGTNGNLRFALPNKLQKEYIRLLKRSRLSKIQIIK